MKRQKQFSGLLWYFISIYFAVILYRQLDDAVYYALEDVYRPILHPLFILAFLVIIFVSTIVIHELGHLVFGLISGYRFVSLRILGFVITKRGNHIKLSRSNIPGIGGQCLMKPPVMQDGKYPVKAYLRGGLIFNALQIIGLAVIHYSTEWYTIPHEFSTPFITYVIYMIVINAFPRLSPTRTDGTNLRSLKKDPRTAEALWYTLEINRLLQDGSRYRDLPEDWFPALEHCDLTQYSGHSFALQRFDRHLDALDFQGAKDLGFQILREEQNMQQSHAHALYAELLFCAIMTQEDPTVILLLKRSIPKSFRKAMRSFPSIWRLQYAEAMLLDHDPKAAEVAKRMFESTLSKNPSLGLVKEEQELMNCLEQLIVNV